MEEILLRKLISANYVKLSTEVDANVNGRSLDGQQIHRFNEPFTVTGLFESKTSGRVILQLASLRDGCEVRVNCDSITGIDGMTPIRFAENYMIAPDGTDIKVVGKRRGRRPKNWNPENDQ